MTKLQVTIIDCIVSIRCADNTYRLLITGIRNYKLKLPLQTYFDWQPPETLGTCSPGDPLPFDPNSKFRRYSQATAHAGEKRMSIIGTLR